MIQAEYRNVDGMIALVHAPDSPGPYPVFLLLHGLTGDETSMWVFTARLPEQALLIAPRGIYKASPKGYSWRFGDQKGLSTIADFNNAIDSLSRLLSPQNFPDADFAQLKLVGFSQGAALALSMLLLHPGLIHSAAGLSGFLPEGSEVLADFHPLSGKRVFLAHGTLDKQVPIALGRRAVEILELAGASVTYCEDEVGHKLSASCFRGLEAFFSRRDNF